MITLDTPIQGPVDCAWQQVRAVIDAHGPPASMYDARMVELVARSLVEWSGVFGLRTSVIAGQVNHETNYLKFTGDVPAENLNFAGLGATGGVPGYRFPTIDAGIIAVCVHHYGYLLGAVANWPENLRRYADRDPRLGAVLSSPHAGQVTVIGDYTNGRWAFSADKPLGTLENGYARAIVAKANEILSVAPEREPDMDLSQTILGRIAAYGVETHDIRMPMPNDDGYSRYSGGEPTHTAVHYTAVPREPAALENEAASWIGHGNYHRNSQGWPGIAYSIGVSPSGRVFLLGDVEKWRYHVFSANPRTFPVSCDLGPNQQPTDAMLHSLNVVLRVLHYEAPEFPGLVRGTTYGHRELSFLDQQNAGTACPGALLPYVVRYRGGEDFALESPAPAPPAPADELLCFPETGHCIGGGFRQFWLEQGGLPIFGYPLSEEFTDPDSGVTVQWFERARFEHQVAIADNPWGVVLGRIGAESLEADRAQVPAAFERRVP